MNAHLISLEEAIKQHREAVLADEASFDDHHNPIDDMPAERTGADEVAAFRVLTNIPCMSSSDVQAKLDYVLNGSIGIRQPMLECLGDEEYGAWDGFEAFLRSLLLQEAAR